MFGYINYVMHTLKMVNIKKKLEMFEAKKTLAYFKFFKVSASNLLLACSPPFSLLQRFYRSEMIAFSSVETLVEMFDLFLYILWKLVIKVMLHHFVTKNV